MARAGGLLLVSTLALLLASLVDAQLSHFTSSLPIPAGDGAAASVGAYAVVGGGSYPTTNDATDKVYVITVNEALVIAANLTLSQPRHLLAATSYGTWAYFGGGSPDPASDSAVVDIIDTATMTSEAAPVGLTIPRHRLAAATMSTSSYVIFGGGISVGTQVQSAVDAFELTPWQRVSGPVPNLGVARCCLAAASYGDVVVFAGGLTVWGLPHEATAAADVYDSPYNRSGSSMQVARGFLAACTINEKLLFAGGTNGTHDLDVIGTSP